MGLRAKYLPITVKVMWPQRGDSGKTTLLCAMNLYILFVLALPVGGRAKLVLRATLQLSSDSQVSGQQ
ncbi:hypothetical protein WJX73_002228 [Symbiochloris irregularis]|uniref:Uncharacterized protein n=1 Tax=Symbiochloris irregularis TaxID=706552 RepID=A0AAW1NNG8_9CHLO